MLWVLELVTLISIEVLLPEMKLNESVESFSRILY